MKHKSMSKRLKSSRRSSIPAATGAGGYDQLLGDITGVLEAARHAFARIVNALMTATYWEVGGASWNTNKAAKNGRNMVKRFSSGWLRI